MGRSSLRTITNINIDGQTLDAATQRQTLSFKVNCDSLSWVTLKYYDNTNGETFTRYYPKGGVMIAKHNGETFSGWFGYDSETGTSPFTLGHDYTAVPTIYQNYPETGHPDNVGEGKYDVILGSGRVQESVSSSASVYIDKGITSIKSPIRYGDPGSERLIGGCMFEIGGVQTLIESYNSRTGLATLTSAITADAGTQYSLVSNYLECDPFNWYCRSDPVVTLTAAYSGDGVTASGTYSQAEGTAMQSYQFSFGNEQGDKSFTYTFEDAFPIPFDKNAVGSRLVMCDVVTQDGHYSQAGQLPTANTNSSTMTLTATEITPAKMVTLSVSGVTVTGSKVFFWRSEDGCEPVLVAVSSNGSAVDMTPESGKTYTYRAAVCISGTVYFADKTLTITSKRTRITALSESGRIFHRRKFLVGTAAFFDIGTEQESIDRRNGAQLVEVQTGEPNVIYSEQDYETGRLRVYAEMLGNITEPMTNGLNRIMSIMEFLSQKKPFLIADNSGNTHIVTITSVSREYDYKTGMTAIDIGWTELCKISEAII
jgi:hypothetical protein